MCNVIRRSEGTLVENGHPELAVDLWPLGSRRDEHEPLAAVELCNVRSGHRLDSAVSSQAYGGEARRYRRIVDFDRHRSLAGRRP